MAIFKILFRLWVVQFYKLNVAFFLFLFLFFFGIVSPGMQIPYHLSIIHSEINSLFILAFVIICWLFYNLKCVAFFATIIQNYKHSFLCELQAIKEKKLLVMIMGCHVLVFLPVTVYAFIVTCIAWQQHKFIAAFVIILSILLMILASSYHLKKMLVCITPGSPSGLPANLFGLRFIVPYFLYPLLYILHEKKVSLFALKIFSFLLFYLVFTRLADNFDKDTFINILILIGYFHSILLFHVHKFLEEKCSFTRNLPLIILKRMMIFFVPVCLLYLPEVFYLCINGTALLSIQNIIILYIMLIAQLMLYTSIIYVSNFQLKVYLRWIFALAFVFIFLNKLMNLDLLIAIQFLVSYLLFKFRYFKYEHVIYSN